MPRKALSAKSNLRHRPGVLRALASLHSLPHEQWPRILGAASGYGMIGQGEARALIDMPPRATGKWWCTWCRCVISMSCPWCGLDACARCWSCPTDDCGDRQKANLAVEMTGEPAAIVTGQWYIMRTSEQIQAGSFLTIDPESITVTISDLADFESAREIPPQT